MCISHKVSYSFMHNFYARNKKATSRYACMSSQSNKQRNISRYAYFWLFFATLINEHYFYCFYSFAYRDLCIFNFVAISIICICFICENIIIFSFVAILFPNFCLKSIYLLFIFFNIYFYVHILLQSGALQELHDA